MKYRLLEQDIIALSALLNIELPTLKKMVALNILNSIECRRLLVIDHFNKLGYIHTKISSQDKIKKLSEIFNLSEDRVKQIVYKTRKTYHCKNCGHLIKTKALFVQYQGLCSKCAEKT